MEDSHDTQNMVSILGRIRATLRSVEALIVVLGGILTAATVVFLQWEAFKTSLCTHVSVCINEMARVESKSGTLKDRVDCTSSADRLLNEAKFKSDIAKEIHNDSSAYSCTYHYAGSYVAAILAYSAYTQTKDLRNIELLNKINHNYSGRPGCSMIKTWRSIKFIKFSSLQYSNGSSGKTKAPAQNRSVAELVRDKICAAKLISGHFIPTDMDPEIRDRGEVLRLRFENVFSNDKYANSAVHLLIAFYNYNAGMNKDAKTHLDQYRHTKNGPNASHFMNAASALELALLGSMSVIPYRKPKKVDDSDRNVSSGRNAEIHQNEDRIRLPPHIRNAIDKAGVKQHDQTK